MPKLSKAQLKRRGQLSWYNQLVKQGRSSDAAAWAERHRLFVVPPNDSNAHLNAAAQAAYGASVSTEVQGIAAARTTASPLAAYSGGAGVGDERLAQNLDHSAHRAKNPQLPTGGLAAVKGQGLPPAVVGSAPDGALPASPSGEVEGNKQSCQPDKGGLFSNRLENGGWVVSGEGVVGKACRNRWFVEVCVNGQWAKAAVGDNTVRNGQRVRVRLEWVSGDGRDAEYAIVDVLPDLDEPRQAAPVGFAQQGVAGTAHWEPVRQPEPEPEPVIEPVSDPQSDPDSDQPTQAEAASEAADDFLERARRDAMKAFYGV